jgi:hypothetical protein
VILLAKSEIRTIYVQHEPENRVCQRTDSCETDFASSISCGDEGRRGRASVGVGLEWWVARAWSGRQEETSGQQIEARPAKHLALEHLQAGDVPFNRALAPG